ncbi:MAG: poly(R)-hydroxyalkanoic acid synthase subunit PhaE, partial [Verrucomicrobiota bacterium]
SMKTHLEPSKGADQSISTETLQRMIDPWQFLYAGSGEINQTIQKLVEGPEFADIGSLEKMGLKATREWINLRQASADYRMITVKAWTRAFETFSKDMMSNRELWNQGPKAVLNHWLEIANEELIRTQRTTEFLEAQRRLLRAGVDYRLREREMVEVWCDTHSIPTRTEVDDLHDTVYTLRHEVRALKKELAASRKPVSRTPRKKK